MNECVCAITGHRPSRFKFKYSEDLVVQQLFNIHQVLGGFTHAQLAWYTHSEVRTEELQTHECTPHKTLRPFTHAQLGGLENKSIRKEMTDGTVHT